MPHTTVPVSFDRFFKDINLAGDHRATVTQRRDWLVDLLKQNFEVLEAFPSGSMAQCTALRASDIDIMVALDRTYIKNKKPSQVLQSVRNALAQYRTKLRHNGQAVTLCFDSWPNIDVVPAGQVAHNGAVLYYFIPDMNEEAWLATNPKKHSGDIEGRSASCGPWFRKIIKMAKWWSQQNGGCMQSYHIEVIALRTYMYSISDVPWEVFRFFDSATNLCQSSLWHDFGFADSYLTYTSRQSLVALLAESRDLAREAWYYTYGERNEHEGAIHSWRKLFGNAFPVYGG